MSKRIFVFCLCGSVAIISLGLSTVTHAGTLLYTQTLRFNDPGGYAFGDHYSLGTLTSYDFVVWSGGVVDGWGAGGNPVSPFETNLSWAAGEFGDLDGVLWADSPDNIASISVRTTDPTKYSVTIDSFKLAAYENTTPADPAGYLVKMYANDFASLAFFEKAPPPAIDRSSHISVTPAYPLGDEAGYGQISLQWWDPWDIAIDDVQFSVWLVPEPGTLALWGLGIAGLGVVAYRRRRGR